MKEISLLIVLAILFGCNNQKSSPDSRTKNEEYNGPIYDMYIHAEEENDLPPEKIAMCIPLSTIVPYHDPSDKFSDAWGKALTNPNCENPIWSSQNYEEYLERIKNQLKKKNVIAVASGNIAELNAYDSIFGDKIIPSLKFRLDRDNYSVDSLHSILVESKIRLLGEVSNQYNGIAPNDPRMYPRGGLLYLY